MTTVSKSIPSIMTLDFNWDLKFVDGEVAGTAKKTMLHLLQKVKIKGVKPDKAVGWANDMMESGKLRLDKSDYKTLKNWLIDEDNPNMIPIGTLRFTEFFEEFEKENKSN